MSRRYAGRRKTANTFTLDMMEVRSKTYDGDAALYGLTFPNIHLDLDANFEIFSNYWEGRSEWEWAVFWDYGCIYVSDRTFSTPEQALDNFINGEGLYPRYTQGFENVIDKIHDYMNGRVASRRRRARKTRRANMRKRAYNYWESMEFNGDEAVEFRDIIPINVYEGKTEDTDGGYVFDAMLYTYDVMWDEYDEDESYTWGFLIIEDGMYEWGDYSGTFTGTEWEAQDWADGLIQKFIDDYEAGLITPQGMDYYSQYFD